MQDAVKIALQDAASLADSGTGRQSRVRQAPALSRSWTDASVASALSMPLRTRTAFRE